MVDNTKRLYRSRTNRMISGVCAGLGDFFSIDPTVVRLIFVIVGIAGWVFPAVLIYLVMAIVIPEEPGRYVPPPMPATPVPSEKPVEPPMSEPTESRPPEAPGE
jgi:phage shock protein C